MGTGAKNRAVQAGLPIVLAVLVATALLPAPASADHNGGPQIGVVVVCDYIDCKVLPECDGEPTRVCITLQGDPEPFREAPGQIPVEAHVHVVWKDSGGENHIRAPCAWTHGSAGDAPFEVNVCPWWYDGTITHQKAKTYVRANAFNNDAVALCEARVEVFVAGAGASVGEHLVPCDLGI